MSTILSSTIATWVLILFLTLIQLSCVAQESLFTGYQKKDFTWAATMSVASFKNLPVRFGVGMDLEHFTGSHVGFGASLAGGPDYAEVSGSILGFIALNDNSSSGISLLFIPFVLENPLFHFDIKKNQDLSISINLLKLRYIWEEDLYYEESQGLFVSGSLTLKYTHYYKANWSYSFFAEWAALYYSGHPNGFQVGASIGHLSKRRD